MVKGGLNQGGLETNWWAKFRPKNACDDRSQRSQSGKREDSTPRIAGSGVLVLGIGFEIALPDSKHGRMHSPDLWRP